MIEIFQRRDLVYAGVGSRRTPPDVLEDMEILGAEIGLLGGTLRSGAADGADSAFEKGAVSVGGNRQIMIPWAGYNDRVADEYTFVLPRKMQHVAETFAARHHPAWERCSRGARALHARNAPILLGLDLGKPEPVDVVICWTVNARVTGGTGNVIRMADQLRIPVLNMCDPKTRENLMATISFLSSRR